MNELEIIEAQEKLKKPKHRLRDHFPAIPKSVIDEWRGGYNVAVYEDRIFVLRQWDKDGVLEVQYCYDVIGHYTLHGDTYYMTGFDLKRLNFKSYDLDIPAWNDRLCSAVKGYITEFVKSVSSALTNKEHE